MTERGRPEKWNQQLQLFSVSQCALRKGNACHLAVIRLQPLQPLPVVKLEGTLRMQDYRPQIAKIYKIDSMNPHIPVIITILKFGGTELTADIPHIYSFITCLHPM